MSNEEHMHAMGDRRSRKGNVSGSDGDVTTRWLKLGKKRSKKATMRTEAQVSLDQQDAVRKVNVEKRTITIDSGAAVSVIYKDMLPNVP